MSIGSGFRRDLGKWVGKQEMESKTRKKEKEATVIDLTDWGDPIV